MKADLLAALQSSFQHAFDRMASTCCQLSNVGFLGLADFGACTGRTWSQPFPALFLNFFSLRLLNLAFVGILCSGLHAIFHPGSVEAGVLSVLSLLDGLA